jgi:hypothetical protein
MRYIKTYESFKTNETMDMMFMPVDPIAGAADVYKEIGNYIKTKMGDLVRYLGDKYNEFIEKFEEICDMIAKAIDTAGDKAQAGLEKLFGTFNLTTMSHDEVKKVILDKYRNQLEEAVESQKANEGYYWEPSETAKKEIHREQETGQGGAVTSLPKDSGIVQTFLSILQNILGINLYSCGVPMAYLISLVFGSLGMTAVVSMIISLLGGILAIFVIAAARRLVYKLEHE